MRSLCIIFLLLAVMASSCKKGIPVGKQFSLTGTWRIFSIVGGYAGLHQTFPTSEGHVTYVFRADSTCTVINYSDTISSKYSITLGIGESCQCAEYFLNYGGGKLIFEHKHDTLWLGQDGVNDGIASGFVKDE